MYSDERRSFLKHGMIGAISAWAGPELDRLPGSGGATDKEMTGKETEERVQLGKDVMIDLLFKQNIFLGIGAVRVAGVLLRDGKVPLSCEIRNPDGILVTDYIVASKAIQPDRIVLELTVRTRQTGPMDWMLHTIRNRENLYDWKQEPLEDRETSVTVIILPVRRNIGGHSFTGFSYQYKFSSKTFPIYKIFDRGTWEIAGTALGCTSWMRVGHVPAIVTFDLLNQRYSTENYFQGIANPNVFQFLPLQTELQGFTFQTHSAGMLVTRPTQVAHVRTILEKPYGSGRLFHFHQHCNDLAFDFDTSPVEVLYLSMPGNERVDAFNIYEAIRDDTTRTLLEISGIKQDKQLTYGQIEQWDEPDFDEYTDHILPEFIQMGVRRVFIPNQFQNAMNTWGLSNMCCNVDFKFPNADFQAKLARFCSVAQKARIEVMMWGNTAISTLTEMFQYHDGVKKGIDFLPKANSIAEVIGKAKEPFVRNPSHAIEADHYTPRFAALNLRDPDIMAYWMKQWKMAFATGIQGFFLDSSFNMSSDKFHFIQNTNIKSVEEAGHEWYRPVKEPPKAIQTQYHAHLQMVKNMQEVGFSYCGEDLGVFGIHRHGPDMGQILDSLPMWRNCIINFDEKAAGRAGIDPLLLFFKGLAYGIMWNMQWNFAGKKIEAGVENHRASALLHIFNEVNEMMCYRYIHERGSAVRYTSADSSATVWWVFEDHEIIFEKPAVVTDMVQHTSFTAMSLHAKPLSVYMISTNNDHC